MIPEEVKQLEASQLKENIDWGESSLTENPELQPHLHWIAGKWPSLRLNSGTVKVALPYIYTGFVDVLEIDRSYPEDIESLPELVKWVLGGLGYGPKYATALVTSTIMEEEFDPHFGGVTLPIMQVWDIHPSESRRLTEPRQPDANSKRLWQEYSRAKTIRNAMKVEFLKDVLEHVLHRKEQYYVLSDSRVTVTILRSHMSFADEQAGERGWARMVNLLENFWERNNRALCLQTDTFEVWRRIADYNEKSLDQQIDQDQAKARKEKELQEWANTLVDLEVLDAPAMTQEGTKEGISQDNADKQTGEKAVQS